MKITSVLGWEALDSRGRPTVAARIGTDSGRQGRVVVPSGASRGQFEAVELRDGGPRYAGYGVQQAVQHVNTVLGPAVLGVDASDQAGVDAALGAHDDSPGFARIGGNAVLSLSLAAFVATYQRAPGPLRLPRPMINILSGGAHAQRALDIQDVLVIATGAETMSQGLEWTDRVRRATAELAARAGMNTAMVADEGGFGLALQRNRDALELVTQAIEHAGFDHSQVGIAIDVAATQIVTPQGYVLGTEDRVLTSEQWLSELLSWVDAYPIISIEDPFDDDDWPLWAQFTAEVGHRVQIIGDDLFATNPGRLQRGIEAGAGNSVLIKPNQIGTVSQAALVAATAIEAGYSTVTSARSGDTEDHWLVDLALSWNSDQIKVGSLTRSERTAKWNRLLELEADPAVETTLAAWHLA